jgi:hypothetical protein
MSVSPDEGMQLLQQRYAAGDAGAPQYQPEPAAAAGAGTAGGELGIMVRLAAALESNTAAINLKRAADDAAWVRVHPIEIAPQQNNAAGVLQDPDRWGPNDGWAWRIFGWTVVLGGGTTQANAYLDSVNDPTNLLFSTTVSGRWEPSHFYLMSGRQIVWQSVGGGITVCKGNGVEIGINDLPRYMGLKG